MGGKERAVGGYVMGHELAEEGPAGGDTGCVVPSLLRRRHPGVTGSALCSEAADHAFVDVLHLEIGEQAPVATGAERRVNPAFARQAVVTSGVLVQRWALDDAIGHFRPKVMSWAPVR